jgi:uncharacterized protein (DUF58 family)
MSSFVHPRQISSIQSLELRVKTIVEGFMSGLHKSPFHGFSVEFSEFRNYYPGDPLKYVDWKIYGKSDKLMIKKFEAETNLVGHIILDISNSMSYGEKEQNKLFYTKNLALALAYLLNRQNDSVAAYTFTDEVKETVPAGTGERHFNQLMKLFSAANAGSQTNLKPIVEFLKRNLKRKGLIIFFTDMLSDEEYLIHQLILFKKAKHDVIVFHILNSDEIQLFNEERVIFKDLETGEEIDLNANQVKDKYKVISERYLSTVRKKLISSGIDYITVNTNDFYEKYLFDFFRIRSKKF